MNNFLLPVPSGVEIFLFCGFINLLVWNKLRIRPKWKWKKIKNSHHFSSHFISLQVYPGRDITNIVESSHYQKIGGWCRQGALNSAKCKGAQRWVKPFRCLGKFLSPIFFIFLWTGSQKCSFMSYMTENAFVLFKMYKRCIPTRKANAKNERTTTFYVQNIDLETLPW